MKGPIRLLRRTLQRINLMEDKVIVRMVAADDIYRAGDVWGGTDADVSPFIERGTAVLFDGKQPAAKQPEQVESPAAVEQPQQQPEKADKQG